MSGPEDDPRTPGSATRPPAVAGGGLEQLSPVVTPETTTRSWRLVLSLLARLPQASLSRGFGQVADLRLPRGLRRTILGAFARAVGIDLAEAERPLSEYGSLNELFVRRLRPGARTWPTDPATIAAPVDAVLGQTGAVYDGRLLQAKGRWYSVAALLDDEAEAARYRAGWFVTLYLTPRHYHRIHTPCEGRVVRAHHVPGALLPVNGPAVASVENLFPRNERLICYLEGWPGRVAVVAIGAYNVGRISTAFDADWGGRSGSGWVTNRSRAQGETRDYEPPRQVTRGAELMAFHLGSTVVLLLEGGAARLVDGLEPGREVRLGEVLAWR